MAAPPFTPATRMSRILPSASTAAAQKVRDLRAGGRTVLDLTVGEPDLGTPAHVIAAAVAAMEAGQTRYTPVNGTPELRCAIIDRTRRRTGHEYSPAEVTVGGGGKQLIFMAFMASLDEGDEVVVPAPYWVSYPDMVRAHGGRPVIVDCSADDGYALDPARLEQAITPATRWLVLNTPANPTGAVTGATRLAELAAVLDRHPHVRVLSDEIYDEIVFTDQPVPTLLTVAPRLRDRVLVVNGVSKTYAMTGWRLGYAVGDAGLVSAINTLQSQSSSCPSSISQAAAVAALDGDQTVVHESRELYRARRDLLHTALARVPGLAPHLPDGAFYLYVGCAGLIGRRTPAGQVLRNDEDVVLHLLDRASVAAIQGSAYGSSPAFRLSFATSTDVLERAAAAISAAVDELTDPEPAVPELQTTSRS